MGLSEYRRKRDFARTSEPAPAPPADEAIDPHAFVIQKHAATNLHYDLRLRVGDALKSWAIPKGPSLDPREKRLAIEVEDHPVMYATFEGVIPEGQYGAGPMMVWDKGRWSPEEGTAAAALREGMLKFRLEGQRLKGRWMLVRTKYQGERKGARGGARRRSAGDEGEQKHWLLIKERDREASPGIHAETFATSVATGRTMEEIAAGAPPRAPATPPVQALSAAALAGARRAPMPAKLKPQLAVPAPTVPPGGDWFHEIKFDGYRLLIHRRDDAVRILSRRGLDWTSKLPDLASTIQERLSVDAVLDGEAVLLDARGVSDFQSLQNAIHGRRSKSIVFFAFDLPWCDGHDLARSPLEQRRALLAELLGSRQEGRLRFSEHFEGSGPEAFEAVRKHGLEGLVSKRRGSEYTQSRTPAWLKIKCFNQQEFVVGGFSAPEGSREELGALLIGYYDGKALRFAGKVGTGFSTETLRRLAALLRPLIQAKPPFANPPTGADAKGVTWVRPDLVAQVQYRDWTSDGVIRHPSFRGLRDDIEPKSVTREPEARAADDRASKDRATGLAARASRPSRERIGQTGATTPTSRPVVYRLTNPERIVYPDRGHGYSLTKRQVAEYYEAVAERMLPHVAGRPLAIVRCPAGEGTKAFFQKHPVKGMPPAVGGVDITDDDSDEVTRHLMIKDAAGLLGLVQMSALEFHPWGAPASDPDHPDRLIFDLDPGPGVAWKQVAEGAAMLRAALADLRLTAFARVSGGKGVHLVVPLRPPSKSAPGHTWPQVKHFTRTVAETLVRLAPRRFTATAITAQREGRIYIDYLRNTRGATAAASYSTRNRPGAPVALPVSWDELPGLTSGAAFTIPSVMRRLRSEPDPWAALTRTPGTLPPGFDA
ncbi:MAG: DNA ligase D [Phycisphaerales bacterium]